MKTRFYTTIALLLSILTYAAATYQASPLKGKLTIDGKLDEADWQNAKSYNDLTSIKSTDPKLTAKPEFRVLQDSDNVYFGVTINDENVSQLRATQKEYTANPWRDDVVEIFMSPNGNHGEYYQFVFAAGGAIWTQYYEEQGNIKPDPYNPIVNAKFHVGEKSWSMEAQIPLRAFYMTPVSQWKQEWLLNVCTGIYRNKKTEAASWSKVKVWFHESKNFKRMGGFPMKKAAHDYSITEALFTAKGKQGEEYQGDLKLNLNIPVEGSYALEINGEKKGEKNLRRGNNKYTIPAAFKQLGKNRTELRLYDAKGKVVAERFYPISVTFQPLAFNLQLPAYGNSFFPGQDASRLKGEVIVKLDADKVHFSGAGQELDLKVKDGKAAFDISLKSFKEKDFIVKASLKDYDCQAHIRVLDMPEKGHIAWIDDTKFYVDGKPIVLRSFYGASTPTKHPTYMCSNLMETRYKPASKKMACQDFEAFRYSVQLLDKDKTTEAKEALKDQEPSKEVYDWYRMKIEKGRDLNFICYYLSDEPECRGVSPMYLKYLYDFIKELDPYHPVYIISRSPVTYINCCDMMAPHPYNLPQVDIKGVRTYHRNFEVVNRMCADTMKLGLKNKVLFLCSQGYGSLGDNIYADFDNFDEVCANVGILLANGGMGMFPYIWFDHCTRPEMSKAFDFMYKSMEVLEKHIVASVDAVPMSNSNEKVVARLTMPFGKPLLIMNNLTTEPQKVTLKANELKKAKQLFSFRQKLDFQRPSKDTLTMELAPLQWAIITGEKLDAGLPSVEDAKAELVKIRQQMAARGNILYGKAAKHVEISASYDSQSDLREILFNGWVEGRAWLPRMYKYYPQWIQLSFTDEVPQFSKIRLTGFNCGKVKFKYWKYGEWIDINPTVTTDGEYEYTFDIGQTIKTVKLRADWDKQKEKLELYEFELLK